MQSIPFRGGLRKSIQKIIPYCRESPRFSEGILQSTLQEFNGEKDHVHLLVNYPPKVSISKLVNSLKGASARQLRKKKYPTIEKYLYGRHLWSPSYFASSCGGAPLTVLKDYIDQQKSPDCGAKSHLR